MPKGRSEPTETGSERALDTHRAMPSSASAQPCGPASGMTQGAPIVPSSSARLEALRRRSSSDASAEPDANLSGVVESLADAITQRVLANIEGDLARFRKEMRLALASVALSKAGGDRG